jgi:hypothetical protein
MRGRQSAETRSCGGAVLLFSGLSAAGAWCAEQAACRAAWISAAEESCRRVPP